MYLRGYSKFMPSFLVEALAVHRGARLIVRDEITSEIREAVWSKYPPEKSKIGYLFTCEWCASVWVAAAVSARHKSLVRVLALSSAANFIRLAEERLS